MAARSYEDEVRFDEVLRKEAKEARDDGDDAAADRLLGLCMYPDPAELYIATKGLRLAPSGFGGSRR